MCVNEGLSSAEVSVTIFSQLFLSLPLWLLNNTSEITQTQAFQSQLIYNAAVLHVLPSLACPFSHNVQQPPDNSNPPPSLLSVLTWEISLRTSSV